MRVHPLVGVPISKLSPADKSTCYIHLHRSLGVALPGSPFNFRTDIEGLRAVAVLSVVAFHFGVPHVTGGFIGVDIFFVISGYLITSILCAELSTSGSIDLLRFYGRRARRLLPALLLVTVFTVAVGIVIMAPYEQYYLEKVAVASSLYLSNFWLMRQVLDYFAPESVLNPFLHTWSLSVEEQFYLVWPALLLGAQWLGRRRAIAAAMSIAVVVSLAACVYLTEVRQPWAFYSSPTRAWEFGIGGLASMLSLRRFPALVSAVIGWAGLAALFAVMFLIDSDTPFPGLVAVVPVVASAAVMLSGTASTPAGPTLLLSSWPFQKIGAWSYSIYLWHWPIIVYATVLEPHLTPLQRGACFALSLVCAGLSYGVVEHPIRGSRWLAARPWRSLLLGASMTAAGVGVAGVAAVMAIQWRALPMQKEMAADADEQHAASAQSCLLAFTDSNPVVCTFDGPKPGLSIALFGDSHADQWSTPLAELAKTQNWHVTTYLKSSCSTAMIDVYNMRLRRYSPECTAWREASVERILAEKPDWVLMSQFSRSYVKGNVTNLGKQAVEQKAWIDGLTAVLKRFQAAGIRVAVISDTPTPDRNLRICAARAAWRGLSAERCFSSEAFAFNKNLIDAERAAVEGIPNDKYIEIGAGLCDGEKCPATKSGMLVYRDANHMTAKFARSMKDPLLQSLQSAFGAQASEVQGQTAP